MAQATATKSNAKRSTNARNRGPKAADSKGHQGHALAELVLAQATKTGEYLLAQVKSRKEVLKELTGFRDNAEHIEFRKTLDTRLAEIHAEAGKAKLSLNAYCDANPVAASVRVDCSLWMKMSSAVEKGFNGSNVDFDKPWGEITKAATAHLDNLRNSTGNSAANGGGTITNGGPRAKRAGRQAKPVVEKIADFIKQNMRDPLTNAPLAKDNRNLSEVVGKLCEDATVQEMEEVAATVQRMLEMKRKLEAEAADKIKAASDSAKAQHNEATSGKRKGVAGKTTPVVTDEKIEKAQASTGRRSGNGATAHKPTAKA